MSMGRIGISIRTNIEFEVKLTGDYPRRGLSRARGRWGTWPQAFRQRPGLYSIHQHFSMRSDMNVDRAEEYRLRGTKSELGRR